MAVQVQQDFKVHKGQEDLKAEVVLKDLKVVQDQLVYQGHKAVVAAQVQQDFKDQ